MKLFTKPPDMIQAFSKTDLQLHADVTQVGSKLTIQVLQYDDFVLQNYCFKSPLTLVINIGNRWNTVIVDDQYRIYVAHQKGQKEDLIKHLQGNQSFKETFKNHLLLRNVKSIYTKDNDGMSALIVAFIANSQIENRKVTDIGKLVTPDLREFFENSLITYRRVHNLFQNVTKEPYDATIAAKPAKKRGRSEPESPAHSPAKVPRPASEGARAPDAGPMTSRDEEDKSSKVVIRNTEPMTEEQMNSFRKCLNASIGLIEENGVVPRLNDLNLIPNGCLIITCEDAVSLQWLMHEIPKIDKNGMKLTILPVMSNMHIPLNEVDSVEEAFSLLKKQNPGLNTELWCVLGSKLVPNSYSVSVSMDEPSAKVLCNLEWRAKLGLTYIKFSLDSTYPSLAEISTVEHTTTTAEQPDISSHNEHVSCTPPVTHDTNADATNRQAGSASQKGTSEPSTTLGSSDPKGIQITETTQFKATEINSAASAASPEQAECFQGDLQIPQHEIVSSRAAHVQSVTTPAATSVERRDPGPERDANQCPTSPSTDVRQDDLITKSDQPYVVPLRLPVSLKIPPSLQSALTAAAHGDQSRQQCSSTPTNGQVNELSRLDSEMSREYMDYLKLVEVPSDQPNYTISHKAKKSPTEGSQKINSSRIIADSQRSPVPTVVPGEQGCHDSEAKPNNANELTPKDNEIIRRGVAYVNPLKLLNTSRFQPYSNTILPHNPLTNTKAADERPRPAEQPPMEGSRKKTSSRRTAHSQRSSTSTAVRGDQRSTDFRAEASKANEPTLRDYGKSREGQAQLKSSGMLKNSSDQQKLCTTAPSASTTTAAADERPRPAEQPPMEGSRKKTSSNIRNYSHRRPAPTVRRDQKKCPDSQAEVSKVKEITQSREGQAVLNPYNILSTSGVQQNHCTPQTPLITTEAADKEPGQAVQPNTGEFPKETSTTRATRPQRAPAPAGHVQQGCSEFQSEPTVMDLSSRDGTVNRIHLEMDKMSFAADRPKQ